MRNIQSDCVHRRPDAFWDTKKRRLNPDLRSVRIKVLILFHPVVCIQLMFYFERSPGGNVGEHEEKRGEK